MYFAHLDNSTPRICTGITENQVAYPASPNIVQIDSFDDSLIGNIYAAGVFTAPDPAPIPRHITQLGFINRFTDAEAIALDLASIGATVEAATLRRYLAKVQAARFIDLDDDEAVAGVQALEAGGLLATGRAAVILGATIQDGEKP